KWRGLSPNAPTLKTLTALSDGLSDGRRYLRFGRYIREWPAIVDTIGECVEARGRLSAIGYIETASTVCGPLNDLLDDVALCGEYGCWSKRWIERLESFNLRLWSFTALCDLTINV